MRFTDKDAGVSDQGRYSDSNETCPYRMDPPKVRMSLSKRWMERHFKFCGCPLMRYCLCAGGYGECDIQNIVTDSLGLIFDGNDGSPRFQDVITWECYVFGNDIIFKENIDGEVICEILTIADLVKGCED
jgi:hypothetical protein